MIGRDEILALVPHAGRMCLIDRVLSWDPSQIHCEADSHRNPEHPLRHLGVLSAVHIIEYGAQAAAIHASLLSAGPASANKAGMLVSVRDCELRRRTSRRSAACVGDSRQARSRKRGGPHVFLFSFAPGRRPRARAPVDQAWTCATGAPPDACLTRPGPLPRLPLHCQVHGKPVRRASDNPGAAPATVIE